MDKLGRAVQQEGHGLDPVLANGVVQCRVSHLIVESGENGSGEAGKRRFFVIREM